MLDSHEQCLEGWTPPASSEASQRKRNNHDVSHRAEQDESQSQPGNTESMSVIYSEKPGPGQDES